MLEDFFGGIWILVNQESESLAFDFDDSSGNHGYGGKIPFLVENAGQLAEKISPVGEFGFFLQFLSFYEFHASLDDVVSEVV